MSLAGIDVSHYNGPVDWHAAAASISFALAKATQSTGFTDSRFAQNWKEMKEAGIPRGAYHFFDPARNASFQADLFSKTVTLEDGDLPPVLDVEVQKNATVAGLAAAVNLWVEIIGRRTGQTPIIYTTASFWKQIGNPPKPMDCPLWIAQYGVAEPRVPAAWNGWAFWQWSQIGRCSGVSGYVDMNRFAGSLDDLQTLAKPGLSVPLPLAA